MFHLKIEDILKTHAISRDALYKALYEKIRLIRLNLALLDGGTSEEVCTILEYVNKRAGTKYTFFDVIQGRNWDEKDLSRQETLPFTAIKKHTHFK